MGLQPGVTIRPLREMTGHAVFNEVFLDEAVCDHADLIGGAGHGWAVTRTTLHFERTGIGAGGSHAGFPEPGPKGGMLGRRAGDAARDEPPNAKLTLGYADVAALAAERGRAGDPLIRQGLARLYTYSQLGVWNARRGRAEAQRGGGQAVAGIGKLLQTRIVKLAAALGTDVLGASRPAGGRRRPARRGVRRGHGVLARVLDLRRDRRDPAEHRRARVARPAPGPGLGAPACSPSCSSSSSAWALPS